MKHPSRRSSLISSQGPGAAVVRRLLPAAVVVVGVLGFLRWQGQRSGLYGTGTGLLLFTGGVIGVLAVLVWHFARWLDRNHAESQEAQAALRRSGRYFDLAHDMLCTAGFDGRFQKLNGAWTEALGWSDAELTARPFVDFVHPEDRATTEQESGKLAGGALTVGFVNRYETKDGGWRWLEWSAMAAPEEELIYASARDVTERMQAEEARERAQRDAVVQLEATRVLALAGSIEEALESLLPAICEPIGWRVGAFWMPSRAGASEELRCAAFWYGPGAVPAELGAATQQLKLAPGADLPGRVYQSRVPCWVPDVSQEPHSHRSEAAAVDGLHACILLPIVSAGRCLAVIELLSDEVRPADPGLLEVLDTLSGQIAQFLERKHSKAALEASERQTRQILETANEAFISLDERGRITAWNPQAQKTFGWSHAEALGCELADTIVPDGHREAHRRGIERFLASGEGPVLGEPLELTAMHRDGHEFPIELTISALATEDGYSFNAFLRDITERKHAERELGLARDQAVDASRMKSEFLANMSHEIRTPLSGVIGMTDLLLDTDLTAEQAEYAGIARSSGEALLALINDVLDFSKVEAGKLELEQADFELIEQVENAGAMLAVKAHEKGLELIVDVNENVPKCVRGDAARLQQVLVNLVSNAIKFTTEGDVVVRVRCEGATAGAATVRFEVSDNGIGIDPERIDALFDSFSQADPSTTRRYGGTGLGLAISKQLVELMGGEIGARSQEAGSTFWFAVPLHAGRGDGSARRPTAQLAGLRLLVVDDNETNRSILERQVRAWGMQCETAAGGQEALQLLVAAADSGRPYGLCLLDFNMPEMDGIQLTRAIDAAPKLRAVRRILLSSSGGQRGEGEAAGVHGNLTKPVRQSRLFDEIATVMGAAGAGRPSPTPPPNGARRPQGSVPAPRVLLAEDNPVNQRVAVALLEKRGLEVDVAGDGREAVEMSQAREYAGIFMDCQMPGLDGYQATAEIRRRQGPRAHTPIIAMTAHSLTGDRERCLAAGMDDYLTKPLRAEALDDRVSRWVRRGTQPGSEVVAPAADGPLDAAQVDRLRADFPPAAFTELVDVFLRQGRVLIDELGAAVAKDDGDRACQAAHKLRGSCASLGATSLRDLCADVEAQAAVEDMARAGGALPALEDAFAAAAHALKSNASEVSHAGAHC